MTFKATNLVMEIESPKGLINDFEMSYHARLTVAFDILFSLLLPVLFLSSIIDHGVHPFRSFLLLLP